MWRERLVKYLDGPRLARLELALGRDPERYFLDARNVTKIPESDIQWFFRTLELGVLTELSNGDFLSPRPGASERLYWHGSRTAPLTPVGIAIEPVISLGAIGRLIDMFGWPADCLGVQCGNWAFDVTCFARCSSKVIVQCEVKTTEHEIEQMCDYFEALLNDSRFDGKVKAAQSKNWNAKIAELLRSEARFLWALGPGGHERIYRLERSGGPDTSRIIRANADELHFSGH